MYSDRNFTKKCGNCGKEYNVEIYTFPARMEDSRSWDTYYWCPYCEKETIKVHLSSDEDVRTYKVES